MKRYKILRRAKADIDGIWRYTSENWSPDQADSYIRRLQSAIQQLAAGELQGRDAALRPGDLRYAVGSHFVYFRKKDGGIEVIRVLHQKMDARRHL